jgi:hypothetical protein
MTMKTMKVKWTGLRPLLLHSAQLADPLNPIVRKIKEHTAKKTKKTDYDLEEIDRLSYIGSLYLSEDGKPVIPSDNIERCIQLGAQKKRMGKDVAAAVLCSDAEYPLQYDGPKDPAEMYKSIRFVNRKSVAVQNSRVMRVRPMIPTGWVLVFELEYDESVINEKAIIDAMQDAGSLIGLGDWRPKFGRFTVEVVK